MKPFAKNSPASGRRSAVTSISLVALCTLALVAVVSPLGCSKKQPEPKEIKIGAVLPLSGDNATYGVALKKGMDLAIDEINNHGGIHGKKLEVIFEDSQGEPSKGISAFNKLTKVNKVPMVIGDMFSAGTLAIGPIAEKQKVVLLSPTASAVDLTNAGDYIFRIYPSDSYDGTYLADFARTKLNASTASIIYLQVTSIATVSQVFKEKFESLGGKVLSSESYKEGDTDFKGQLLKANNVNPDVLFIPGYLREMALLLKQAKELGIKNPFLSISTFYDSKIFELAGDASEGVLFSSPAFDTSSNVPEIVKFVTLYKSRYNNQTPDILSGYGYDVINIAAHAFSTATSITPENIKTSLYQIKNYLGVTGKTSFDANGDVIKELKIMQVKNGKFVPYQ